MMFWLLIAIAAVAATYYYLIKPHKYWTEKGVKQRPSVFIFGDSWGPLTRQESFAEMVYQIYNTYSNIRYFGIYQILRPTLVLKDPTLIKQIAVKDYNSFLDHQIVIPTEADPLTARFLLTLKGQKWKDMRATISPVFTSSKMKNMFVLMSESAENFVNYFLNKNEDMISVELKDTYSRYANDIIASIAFGVQCDSLKEKNNAFYTTGKQITNFGLLRGLKFLSFYLTPKIAELLKLKFFTKAEESFFINLIKEIIEMREEQGIIRPDLIHLLLEARKNGLEYEENNHSTLDAGFAIVEESEIGKTKKNQKQKITDIDITGQALFFFLAGFDSISNSLCFLSYEIGIHSEIQKRLQQEIDETLKSYNGKVTYEALIKMKYMDMVVCENLRKWPGAASTDRVCTTPYTIQPTSADEKPLHLMKGDITMIPIYGLHMDPTYFPNPDKFDPERFSDVNKHKIIPHTYMPFGTGPRNCIGSRFAILETKTLIFNLLSKFNIVPIEKTEIPVRLSKKQINLKAEHGVWFGFERRNICHPSHEL